MWCPSTRCYPAKPSERQPGSSYAALRMRELGGDVHQLIGDAVMVVFNKHGNQPDHPRLAARAALAFQETAGQIAAANPDWPRFRDGVNSGEIASGIVGDRGHRKHDVIGDTVNLAARLESQARSAAC